MKHYGIILMLLGLCIPAQADLGRPHQAFLARHVGDGIIPLYNIHTGEYAAIRYRDGLGKYDEEALAKIDHLVRCHYKEESVNMSLKVIELVDHIGDHFGAEEIHLISGYRSPEYNTLLRQHGHGVASKSYHMQGFAMDIRIPGVPARKLRDFARSLKAGGVGYYEKSQFVHVDAGPVRSW